MVWKALVAAICIAGLGAIPAAVAAEDEGLEAAIEELFLAELAFLQDAGEFQVSGRIGRQSSGEGSFDTASLALEYGINDWFQIGLEGPYERYDADDMESAQRGFGKLELGFSARLHHSEGFIISAGLEAELPTQDEDLGENEFEWGPQVNAAWNGMGRQFYVGLNYETSADESAFGYSAAVALATGPIVPILEWTGTSDEEGGHYLTPGLVAELADDVEGSLGVTVGLDENAADWGLMLTLTREF